MKTNYTYQTVDSYAKWGITDTLPMRLYTDQGDGCTVETD